MNPRLRLATERATDALLARGWRVATAESCTGGMVAVQLTDIGGSSTWFDCGFVTYSNEAKVAMLGVLAATIDAHGAVSAATAREMARGALARSNADVAVAITGIAGPSGGTPDKPIGTVWFATAVRGGDCVATLQRFDGDRAAIRERAAAFALEAIAHAAAPAIA